MSTPSHDDIQELLGAYALDAVDPDEAAVVEDHLRGCPRCRAEVAAHRETAAHLVDAHLEPPAALWDRVAADLHDTAPPLDLDRYRAPAVEPRRAGRRRPLAAAAAVAALLGLGGVVYQQDREVDDLKAVVGDQEVAVAALAALDDPQGRLATLAGAGAPQLRAVVLPDGTGYLLADRLPTLAGERTYQLWCMVDGHPRSAGVLGADPGVVAFRAPEGTAALAVSVEQAGGARTPTLPAALSGRIAA